MATRGRTSGLLQRLRFRFRRRSPGLGGGPRVWPAGLLLILGAIGLWFAETYKPSAANILGLNDNKFYLKSDAYHALVIVSIVLLVLGGIRLLMAVSR